MIEFRLDSTSGVTTYWQLVQQVRQAVRVGRLRAGDQLPTVREVVAKLAINPNTVLKAYRELERDNLVSSRPGQGTFVTKAARAMPSTAHAALRRSLERWVLSARQAGLDTENIRAIVATTLQESEEKVGIG
ncbi:MAG: GntR family transcriptional regulator [Actinomycetota bacterium]|nr:GntR family transcriptional regulator [Actinomycetota bacterium]